MGLNISHGAFDGSYSTFNRLRESIAKYAGVPPLGIMQGFYVKDGFRDPMLEVNLLFAKDDYRVRMLNNIFDQFPIKWDSLKPSYIHELLYHSDCDGYINWKACEKIANELEKLLPLMSEDAFCKERTECLIIGMRLAYSKKQKLEFQ